MAANKFLGQYQNTKTENLDPYMRALGKSYDEVI